MDNFFDDFDEGVFMDGDDFEDRFDENLEPEDCFEEGPEAGDPGEAESQEDSFSGREAFMFGVAMGWAYEEGLEEAERWMLEKKMRDDINSHKRDSKA